MNYSLTILETSVVALGVGLLLLDLWTPPEMKRQLGYAAAASLGLVLLFSFSGFVDSGGPATAFGGMFVQDRLALFFKRFFLVAAIVVLIMSVEFADRIATAISVGVTAASRRCATATSTIVATIERHPGVLV